METGASVLQELYASESAKIQARFEQSGDGKAAIRERSALIDSIVSELWSDALPVRQAEVESRKAEGFCIAALGGYGRRSLFPYSDVDLLFLSDKGGREEYLGRTVISPLSQSLWDLHLRVSPTTRVLSECGKLHRDNIEFNIALLDCRYICGDQALFEKLQQRVLPEMVAREAQNLMQELTALARERHQKYGGTIFHLEPNIKDGPGGLRDYQVACWLAQIRDMQTSHVRKNPEELLPAPLRSDAVDAIRFLDSVRCFLHYRQGRDLNGLTYELQSEAAAAGIGVEPGVSLPPSQWMRIYFRHARAIYRLAVLLDEVPKPQSRWSKWFSRPQSDLSTDDFRVVDSRVFLKVPESVQNPAVLWRLFELLGSHKVRLSAEAENTIEAAVPRVASRAAAAPDLWEQFRRVLLLPRAGSALRAMHRLGFLTALFPEFQVIDSLVVRDYYHRYTVDEHSFVALDNLHRLADAGSDMDRRFRDILRGIDTPDLLYLALLFHDVGKGMPVESHIEGSLQAAKGVFERLRLDPEARDTVNFLIGSHLRMSVTLLRRDVFDPEAVHDFSEAVGTIERLKMLTLFTYADVKAVNPEALTPWKAEMLWQLYAATENYLNRSIDDQRLYLQGADTARLDQVVSSGVAAIHAADFRKFLDGFPKRYLLTNSPAEIASHYWMYKRLSASFAEITVTRGEHDYELVLVTTDRPFLFTNLVGALSSWGMNILKADACGNAAGIVVDTLRFADHFRTLEHNPSEMARLKETVLGALSGALDVAGLMQRKFHRAKPGGKVPVETRIHFDNDCSSHATVVEIIAMDRPGLLYAISSTLAERDCNIAVALIDTEGSTATDVFYITQEGSKLPPERQHELQSALEERL